MLYSGKRHANAAAFVHGVSVPADDASIDRMAE